MEEVKYSKEWYNRLATEYVFTGISLTKLANKEYTDRRTLSKKFLEMGILIVNLQNTTKFSENIFDSIDSEEKAYWLGFLFADGYLSSNNYTIELSLKGSDYLHLYKFQNFLGLKVDRVKISKVRCNNSLCERCRIFVTNKHLWNVLNSYGCTPRKSLTLKFPDKNIFKSEDLIKHFIRGYFDGDGCISTNKLNEKIFLVLSVTGTKEFLKDLVEYLPYKSSVFTKDKRHLNNTFTVNFRRVSGYENLKFLYQESNIYLDRKYNYYILFKDNYCQSLLKYKEIILGELGEEENISDTLTN